MIHTIKVKLDEGAIMPQRAHEADAGYDLFAPQRVILRRRAVVDTGVHIAIPEGYVGFIKSKSGLNVKHDIVTEGVIDSGYTGSIVVKLDMRNTKVHIFERGEKIAQLVLLPIFTPALIEVDGLEVTERGNGGFGSTGK